MKAIDKKQHIRVVSILLQIEQHLAEYYPQEQDLRDSRQYCKELETAFNDYEQLLSSLKGMIDKYDRLFSKVRYKFLSPRLKHYKPFIDIQRKHTDQ